MQVESAEAQLALVREYFDALEARPPPLPPDRSGTGRHRKRTGAMAARKKTRSRREAKPRRGARRAQHAAALAHRAGARQLFRQPERPPPGHLYDLVMREVEEPLFRAVLDYADGNQSRAADILGINRGTLRKKLQELRPLRLSRGGTESRP